MPAASARAPPPLGCRSPRCRGRLAQLEARVGKPLFIRDRRPLQATALGMQLAAHGRRILEESRKATEAVQSLLRGTRGLVRVCGVPFFMDAMVSRIIAAFQTANRRDGGTKLRQPVRGRHRPAGGPAGPRDRAAGHQRRTRGAVLHPDPRRAQRGLLPDGPPAAERQAAGDGRSAAFPGSRPCRDRRSSPISMPSARPSGRRTSTSAIRAARSCR